MEETDITDDSRVVVKAALPMPIDGMMALVDAAEKLYGKDLVILTNHPDSRKWVVIARPSE